MMRDEPEALYLALSNHQRMHSRSHYYFVRGRALADPIEKSAAFIYLNRACWNGLFRVNKAGLFNVPIGTKSNILLPTDTFSKSSTILKSAKIVCSDFDRIISKAKKGDFLFADPPYTVKHDNNGFVKYNENIFSWDDQRRLHGSLSKASQRGVKIMITNANHTSLLDLYDTGDWHVDLVSRSSVISGLPAGRSLASELVIRNYSE